LKSRTKSLKRTFWDGVFIDIFCHFIDIFCHFIDIFCHFFQLNVLIFNRNTPPLFFIFQDKEKKKNIAGLERPRIFFFPFG